jgi:hypothetical protein
LGEAPRRKFSLSLCLPSQDSSVCPYVSAFTGQFSLSLCLCLHRTVQSVAMSLPSQDSSVCGYVSAFTGQFSLSLCICLHRTVQSVAMYLPSQDSSVCRYVSVFTGQFSLSQCLCLHRTVQSVAMSLSSQDSSVCRYVSVFTGQFSLWLCLPSQDSSVCRHVSAFTGQFSLSLYLCLHRTAQNRDEHECHLVGFEAVCQCSSGATQHVHDCSSRMPVLSRGATQHVQDCSSRIPVLTRCNTTRARLLITCRQSGRRDSLLVLGSTWGGGWAGSLCPLAGPPPQDTRLSIQEAATGNMQACRGGRKRNLLFGDLRIAVLQ